MEMKNELFIKFIMLTVNNYMQVTGIATGENLAFFIYGHFVETLWASAVDFKCITIKTYSTCL